MSSPIVRLIAAVSIACTGASGCSETSSDRTSAPPASPTTITAVQGRSLIDTVGVAVDDTMFGKVGGEQPAPATSRREPMPKLAEWRGFGRGMMSWLFGGSRERAEPFEMTGADLYRISCQSCHGPHGGGAPPEINSLVGPVQGTSTQLLVDRMKKEGRPVDEAFFREVTAGATGDLRKRISEGGEKMPSFTYLTAAEVDALVGYLQRMVGIPEAPASSQLTLPADAVGERVVKGTCHTCHNATGPGRHALMMQGITPSLASMPAQEGFDELVAKVREGIAPRMMTMMMSSQETKMPKLPYLTEPELAGAMRYLSDYPPQD